LLSINPFQHNGVSGLYFVHFVVQILSFQFLFPLSHSSQDSLIPFQHLGFSGIFVYLHVFVHFPFLPLLIPSSHSSPISIIPLPQEPVQDQTSLGQFSQFSLGSTILFQQIAVQVHTS
jgi:hypothetical protein